MKKTFKQQIVGWGLILVLFLAIWQVNAKVDHNRTVLGMKSPTPMTKIVDFDPTAVTGVVMGAALGGFRGVAATMLWLKMQELWDRGQGTWYSCLQVMRDVTLLDPYWLEPWKILGWHLAYNLYVESKDPRERGLLMAKGVAALKEGISWNPSTYELYAELGWTYFDKVKDYEQATKWFRASLQFPHPEYLERMIAHAYEQLPDIDRALDWYDYCLKRNPTDGTARGAITTVRLRYLPAWRLMQAGKYDQAIVAIDQFLKTDPNGTIGLHVKAHIYEQAGKQREALETWRVSAKVSSTDQLARYKVTKMSAEMGLPVPAEEQAPTYLMEQYEKHQLAAPSHKGP